VSRRRRTRRLLGASALLPVLLFALPLSGRADSDHAPAHPRRPAPTSHRTGHKPLATARSERVDQRAAHPAGRVAVPERAPSNQRVTPRTTASAKWMDSAAPKSTRQRASVSSRVSRRTSTPPAIELQDGIYLANVGPLRVPTRLFVAVPNWADEGIDLAWPVEGPIVSGFGRRTAGWHAGIDIQADIGTPIVAAAPGTVLYSGWAPFYGRVVKIQHPNGCVTIYAHNHENLVETGDEVAAGAVIATVGRSGRASAEHLHFEVRRDGTAFNPLYFLGSHHTAPMLASAANGPPLDEGTGDYEVP